MKRDLTRCVEGDEAVLTGVVVRLMRPQELRRWNRLMSRQHYLGNAHLVGETLRYVVEPGPF